MLPWRHHFHLLDVVGEDLTTCYPYPYLAHIRNLFSLSFSALTSGAFQLLPTTYPNGGTSLRDLVCSLTPLGGHTMWYPLSSRCHLSRPSGSEMGHWPCDSSTFIQLPSSTSWRAAPLPLTPSPSEGYIKGPLWPSHQTRLDLLLTPSRPVKVSLVLSSLVFASTHWYCGLLISLLNLSHTSDLLGVISHTHYTHIHWIISSYYMSIHIQYISTGDQLSCISSLHQPSSSAALQAAYSSDLQSSSAIILQLPTLLSYCFINQYMTSKYNINTVSFINNQLWYLIACCWFTQEIEIIDSWSNSLHWSPITYCWLLRVDITS